MSPRDGANTNAPGAHFECSREATNPEGASLKDETSNPVGRAKIRKAAYAAFFIFVCSGVGLVPSAERAQVRQIGRIANLDVEQSETPEG